VTWYINSFFPSRVCSTRMDVRHVVRRAGSLYGARSMPTSAAAAAIGDRRWCPLFTSRGSKPTTCFGLEPSSNTVTVDSARLVGGNGSTAGRREEGSSSMQVRSGLFACLHERASCLLCTATTTTDGVGASCDDVVVVDRSACPWCRRWGLVGRWATAADVLVTGPVTTVHKRLIFGYSIYFYVL
jgi:hypothetical protein